MKLKLILKKNLKRIKPAKSNLIYFIKRLKKEKMLLFLKNRGDYFLFGFYL